MNTQRDVRSALQGRITKKEPLKTIPRHTLRAPIAAGVLALTAVVALTRASVSPEQVAKLLPNDGAAFDLFGLAVDVSGDYAIIGAKWDDDNCPTGAPDCNTGSAYIFERTSGVHWIQRAKLTASDAASGDNFGYPVAIDGDTAVVGSPQANIPNTNGVSVSNAGAAYVFTRDAVGNWTQQKKLVAPDPGSQDYFGLCVSISGDTIVVGALFDVVPAPDGSGTMIRSGSAYVFTRDAAGVWTQQAKLLSSDRAAGDKFGRCTAINGDTVVIGALLDDNDNGMNSGSAYVFNRNAAGAWSQTTKLTASDGAQGDNFGKIVAISDGADDTIVVGARFADIGGKADAGAAYVFNRNAAGAWSQTTKLTAPDGEKCDWFGVSAEISGNAIVIGAKKDDNSNAVISPGPGTEPMIMPDGQVVGDPMPPLGVSAEAIADTIVSGAKNDDHGNASALPPGAAPMIMPGGGIVGDPMLPPCPIGFDSNRDQGAAYVFTPNNLGGWTSRAKLLANDRAGGDFFGVRVAISGETIIVGASRSDNPGESSGSAYIFDLNTCIPSPYTNCPPEFDVGPTTGGIGVRAPGCTDLNGDGVVNGADLAILFAHWEPSGATGPADLTGDGAIDSADISTLLVNWGPCR